MEYSEEAIRNLAKSDYWQSLYRSSKDLTGIYLFDNNKDFSGIQVSFLYWLKVYSMLYEELYSQEWDNLYQKTIDDHILCDAFLYFRGRELDKKTKEYRKDEKKNRKKSRGSKRGNGQDFNVFKGVKEKV